MTTVITRDTIYVKKINVSHMSYLRRNLSAQVLLNLLNELEIRDKMRGLPSILSLFRNEFNNLYNT